MGALGKRAIEKRKDEIFVGGTFEASCLRAAVYDLRIQNKLAKTTGSLSGSTLILERGQLAVVETFERIAMPWNLTGNLGIKARLALQGLFVTQGLFVDPGFGWVGTDPNRGCPGSRRSLKAVLPPRPLVLRA
ncbi:MAG: hypothetical protein ACLP1Q_19870 [Solirubrobacteraceae bacterium]